MTKFSEFLSKKTNFSTRVTIKRAIKEVVNSSGLSVDQIAIEINYLMGTNYKGSSVYNWTSTAHEHIPNAETLVALCYVVSSIEPLQALITPLDKIIQIVDITQIKLLEIISSKETEMVEKEKQESYWKEIERIKKRYRSIGIESPINEVKQ